MHLSHAWCLRESDGGPLLCDCMLRHADRHLQEAGPPSPTRGRPRPAWHHPGTARLRDGQQPQPPDRQHRPDQPGQAAVTQQQQPHQQKQPRPDGGAQLADANGAPGGAAPALSPATSAAPVANGMPGALHSLAFRCTPAEAVPTLSPEVVYFVTSNVLAAVLVC